MSRGEQQQAGQQAYRNEIESFLRSEATTTRPGRDATIAVINPPMERKMPCIPEVIPVSAAKYAIRVDVNVLIKPATM